MVVNQPPTCSFCGKSKDQVEKLIAGDAVFICDECVALCLDILGEPRREVVTRGEPESDGSWRIEVHVQTDQSEVRDRILSDIDSWRRVAQDVTAKEVDLLHGTVRLQESRWREAEPEVVKEATRAIRRG